MNHRDNEVLSRRLEGAEEMAVAAVRTYLVTVANLESGELAGILDDVDDLFARVEATEALVALARGASDPEAQLAYAEGAYGSAQIALARASERARRSKLPRVVLPLITELSERDLRLA